MIAIAGYLQIYYTLIKEQIFKLKFIIPCIIIVILLINSIISSINLAVFYKVSSYNFMKYKEVLINYIQKHDFSNTEAIKAYFPGKDKIRMNYSNHRHNDLLKFYEISTEQIIFEYNNENSNWIAKEPDTNPYSTVNKGEIVAILGPNGAGKSTAMKAMLGLINLKSGTVTIDGKDISNLSPQDRVKQGISFVPQTRNVFTGLSVKENLEMGAFLRKEDLEKVIEEIYQLFPILKEKQSQLVGELSGGQRQQVALGRALMIKPSVLMLDEPTAGVSPIVMDELFEHILKVKKTNVAIIMVEQNAKQALSISDRGYVLVTGENKFSGTGNELLNNPEVRRSFLGA
jgi:branched-chain amino acid transport system ATP-binding protein